MKYTKSSSTLLFTFYFNIKRTISQHCCVSGSSCLHCSHCCGSVPSGRASCASVLINNLTQRSVFLLSCFCNPNKSRSGRVLAPACHQVTGGPSPLRTLQHLPSLVLGCWRWKCEHSQECNCFQTQCYSIQWSEHWGHRCLDTDADTSATFSSFFGAHPQGWSHAQCEPVFTPVRAHLWASCPSTVWGILFNMFSGWVFANGVGFPPVQLVFTSSAVVVSVVSILPVTISSLWFH